jgi:Ser/Thr protein kinase RdoA (MazF antagonist)
VRHDTAVSAEAVLRHYPLDAPSVTGRHDAGIINDNLLVVDSPGKRYLLRGYRRVRDPERVLFQLRFQEHLSRQGFPTASVVEARNGELVVAEGGVPWSLHEFVEGDEFDFSRLPQAVEAGRRLAQFHTVSAGYAGRVAPATEGEWDFSSLSVTASSRVSQHPVLQEGHEERLRELFPEPEFEPDLDVFAGWRRKASAEWPGHRVAALPHSWLHCDYHGRNMVFRGDVMAGLFDFDYLTRGPRTFDLARGLFNFGRERRGSRTLRDEFCRAFLDGYESGAPLTGEERRALGFMAVLNWAPDARFYSLRRLEEGDEGIARRLHADVGMMRAIHPELLRLAPSFGWSVV